MFLSLLWLAVPGYLVLQVVGLRLWSGGARIAAAVPLIAMVPVFVLTAAGLIQGSDLWPLLLLLTSPVALLYLVIVGLANRGSTQPLPATDSPRPHPAADT